MKTGSNSSSEKPGSNPGSKSGRRKSKVTQPASLLAGLFSFMTW